MSVSKEIDRYVKDFETRRDIKEKIDKTLKLHSEFLKRYPFRKDPSSIDKLTPESLYNPGSGKDYFFYWVEFKLRPLGSIRVGSDSAFRNAAENIDKFKELLRKAVDDSIPLSEKVDMGWEQIKGFGGDKIIAKKIISCYYLDDVLPIFKTKDLEHFLRNVFQVDVNKRSLDEYGKRYETLTLGEKYELLNRIMLEVKVNIKGAKGWNNAYFTRFLYEYWPPSRPAKRPELTPPLHDIGLLFEPRSELEVIYLFSILHKKLKFPYIVKIRDEYPDATVINHEGRMLKIEFEVRSSEFLKHGHDPKYCDYIVCWEDDLEEIPENFPEVISLKKELRGE